MKTIHITIDDELHMKVDQVTQLLGAARSQFIRQALEDALRKLAIEELEQRQLEGYKRFPVNNGEFDIWEAEQSWG